MKKLYYLLGLGLIIVFFNSCKENTNAEGILSPYISIQDIKLLYKGEDVLLTRSRMKSGAHLVRGTVISGLRDDNRQSNTIVIQGRHKDLLRGIAIELEEGYTDTYTIGDSILIDVENKYLRKVDGGLRISGVTPADITVLASGLSVEPMEVPLVTLNQNPQDYEYTLVKIFSCLLEEDEETSGGFVGDKQYHVGEEKIVLHVIETSALAAEGVPWSATFAGIVIFGEEPDTWRLWPRSVEDMTEASGPIYPNFPEDFENGSLTTYRPSSEYVVTTLKTGSWGFYNSILGTSPNDRMSPAGIQCVRSQRNHANPSVLTMKFDLLDGASKVSFMYGSTAEDPGCYYRLEYSQDEGINWQSVTAEDVYVDNKEVRTVTYMLDIEGKVRFRIYKVTMGDGVVVDNGRLNIDDFAVFKPF